MIIFKYIFLLLLIFSLNSTIAQVPVQQLDSLAHITFNDPNGPGGIIMVAKHGQIVYHKAFGKANLELNTDMNIDMIFQLGSMTKQFTAIAILMLEEAGKLSVQDPVSKYIPDYPNGSNITLHNLLTHTSGIKDFTTMKSLSSISSTEMTPEMMVNFFKHEPVDFLPGEKFAYNNSGYVLLGYIIELVSGETYQHYIQQHIFQKAGMSHSRYASDRDVIKNRAYGYSKKEMGYVNKTRISFTIPYAAGALMSTTSDMLKWQQALNNNLLLGKSATQQAFKQYKLSNGDDTNYGYGWHLRAINHHVDREHGGNIFGFKTMGIYFPDKDIYILGFSNCDCNSPTKMITDIAGIVVDSLK
ncbi:serine hydrolase domain-containing protein [Chitinophaga sp. Hz27]|uniref:serine hydrolase domain-containing protein n=1 Tax=Chitinophaga sp. Hz27 TaxID=3347169 RepID=UPI0035D672E9